MTGNVSDPAGANGTSTSVASASDSVSGSAIHDLGYRRYAGTRVGASGAWSALYLQSVRAMFGLGRPFKSKIVPLLVIGISTLPSLALLAAASQSKGQVPIRYGQLVGAQLLMFVFFMAAQAPEVLSRDQQHRLLPLLFTRDVTRSLYSTARFLGIFSAVFVVALAPLLLLYVGEIGIAADPSAAFSKMGDRVWPVLAQSALSAFAMTGVGAALAIWTPRRAYATASIFGAFLLLAAVSTGMDDLAGVDARTAEFVDPLRAMRTMALLFFHETNRGMELNPPAALIVYVGLTAALGVAGFAILLWRMKRIRA